MNADIIRRKYLDFFNQRGHKVVAPSTLVPENDPTTLFVSSGMQPLITYLLGEKHPLGKKLVNSQRSFRAQDIEEVGDNRHTTFFEMLGNWSLGDYFKKQQLTWFFEFLTTELKLNPHKLYVTVFEGNKDAPKDIESISIWKELFAKKGIEAKEGKRIFPYGVEKNWWSRSGTPDKMPLGEPGGPDSEVFYDFGTKHNEEYGPKCHPNCDCGKYLEIGNSVFMEYKKTTNGFEKLSQQNVDFGGGLERLEAAVINEPDIFKTSIFKDLRNQIVSNIPNFNNTKESKGSRVRIFLDHSRAAIFLISEGVKPGKNEREYIVRRLIRRASDQLHLLGLDYSTYWKHSVEHFKRIYKGVYSDSWNEIEILKIIMNELRVYESVFKHIENERTELIQVKNSTSSNTLASTHAGPIVFKYQSTYGVPRTASQELIKELGFDSKRVEKSIEVEKQKHQNLSRTASAGMFKGGLEDHSEETTKLHTATHLLHAALRSVLGSHVEQKGSHISSERLRFDFTHPQKLKPTELEEITNLINKQIKLNLPVTFTVMSPKEAQEKGALGFFKDKYQEKVKVYTIGNPQKNWFSKEICGGPHIDFTSSLKRFRIIKEEAISSGIRRIYATVEK